MKKIEITEPGKVRVIEAEKPEVLPGMVLLKIEYVGFCGSDLNTFRGGNPLVKMPVVPGHEIGASIAEVGEGVPSGFQKGMHATVNPYTSCGNCPACRNERPNACEFNQTLGVQRDGAMSEYLLLPWEKVLVEDGLSTRDLTLVEPLSVGFHAVSRAKVSAADTVLVFGCGMIGLGVVIRSVQEGARVIAVDVDDKKLLLAKELGVAYTINSAKEDLYSRIASITDRRGVDVVIEAVGHPSTSLAAVDVVAFTGRVVLIGYTKEKVSFDTQYFIKKELDVRGSRNALPEDFQEVMKLLKQGIIPLDKLISAVYSPEEAETALEKWAEKPGDVFRIFIKF